MCKYPNHDAPAEDKVEIVFLRKEKQQFRNFVFCLNLGWRDYCFNFYGISLVNFFYLKYLRLNNVRLIFNNSYLKFVFVFSIRGFVVIMASFYFGQVSLCGIFISIPNLKFWFWLWHRMVSFSLCLARKNFVKIIRLWDAVTWE